jgi:pilus assembly protein Flp/PilA
MNWAPKSASEYQVERTVMKTLAKFAKCESGATAIEYGLIAALIGVAIITVVNNVGTEVKGTFTDVDTGLKKRVSP